MESKGNWVQILRVARRAAFTGLACLCLTGLGTAAFADVLGWNIPMRLLTTKYTPDGTQSVDSTNCLWITPKYSVTSGLYTYSYEVKNDTSSDRISMFALSFDNSVGSRNIVSVNSPSGWKMLPSDHTSDSGGYYELVWRAGVTGLGRPGYQLAPGQTLSFEVTTSLIPSNEWILATGGIEAFGYSGMTYDTTITMDSSDMHPVDLPEVSTLLLAFSGMVGTAGLRFKKKL